CVDRPNGRRERDALIDLRSGAKRERLSFPTRRSSDLASLTERGRRALGAGRDRNLADHPGAGQDAVLVGALQEVRSLARTGLGRSEEHTSELQSRENLVCRLLLGNKKE